MPFSILESFHATVYRKIKLCVPCVLLAFSIGLLLTDIEQRDRTVVFPIFLTISTPLLESYTARRDTQVGLLASGSSY